MFHRPPRPEDSVHNIVCGKGIKVLLKNKVIGPRSPKQLGHPVSSLLYFLAEFPSGAWRLAMYTYALASKNQAKGSTRRGTLYYSNGPRWPNIDGAKHLFQGFISSPRKPSYSASFLH